MYKKRIPVTDEFLKQRKINDILYSYLQSISYVNGGITFVYKKQFIENIEDVCILLGGIKRRSVYIQLKNLSQFGFVKEEKIEDNYGRKVDAYILSYENKFKEIPIDTLKYLVDTMSTNVIKVYVYLLNKYEWKHDYNFTKKELLEHIGYKKHGKNNYATINNLLDILIKCNLIKISKFKKVYDDGTLKDAYRIVYVKKHIYLCNVEESAE